MKRTDKSCFDVEAVCSECGRESVGAKDAWKWARSHALETGHIPTVTASFDLWACTPPKPIPNPMTEGE